MPNWHQQNKNRNRTYIVSHTYVCCSRRTIVVLILTLHYTNKVHGAPIVQYKQAL